ncbi:Dynamin domain-containing protein [Desulfonema limicola]|uniref:Dynamin domain-containing protein n=1 Tax=Desulfonema limicola TaxID=45656 RepID=A0A975BBQ7_9BACT|nr:dynamin family protein [Desulfonema limicola]QTA82441.1 Dynamin domain-containing protein [Desulfonema limicola]
MTRWDRFEQRKDNIEAACDFFKETEDIDRQYDRQEKGRTSKFKELRSALDSKEIKIVVVGEFGRGKSMLLNALMGLELLPTAFEQTTAINAFIQKVPSGREPYVKILFQDGKFEELPFEKNVIRQWGTELDKENSDLRLKLERIEVYADNELLKNNVILIDTPGFRGVLPRHEDIARQAMNESHVAIWLQSVEQLGGNIQEWEFMNELLSPNFNKFITIVNKWDMIYAEADENKISKEQYSLERLEGVKNNFLKFCTLSEKEISVLVSSKNLMGVSAKWALSNDPVKQEKSNIQKLADRIQEMCTSGEGQEQILIKPLKHLEQIQKKLKSDIESELKELENPRDLDTLSAEKGKVDFEIRNLELERKEIEAESRHEHNQTAAEYAKDIQHTLVMPLKNLKNELEQHITEHYIRRQIQLGVKKIELPENVKEHYEYVSQKIAEQWRSTKDELLKVLDDLRAGFSKQMGQISERLSHAFQETSFNIPKLDLNLNINLDIIHNYQTLMLQLETQLEDIENEKEEIEKQIEIEKINREELRKKIMELEQRKRSVLKQSEILGPQPSPIKWTEQKVEKGIWRNTTYPVEVTDDSNVKEWEKRKAELAGIESNKELEIQRIIQEESEKRGYEITREFAIKKLEKKLFKIKKAIDEYRENLGKEESQIISETLDRMKKATINKVDNMIHSMENKTAQSIEKIFQEQLDALIQCVQEQYADRLETRKKQLESVEHQIRQGKESITNKKNELNTLINRLDILLTNTNDLFKQVTEVNYA